MTMTKTINESTRITLTLKHFFIALGIFKLIVIVASWFIIWYLGSDIQKATLPLMKKEVFEEWQEKKFDPHMDKFNETYKDVGVLLERTKNIPGVTHSFGRHNVSMVVPPN